MKPQLLGLDLDVDEGDWEGMTPLCGFAVLKMLDTDGKVCYLSAATGSLKSIECLGMARYAVLRLERGLMADLEDGE